MNDETQIRTICDGITARAAQIMVEEGASVRLVLDRLLTFSVAQACHSDGAFQTVALLQNIIEQVESGKFAHVEPRGMRN